MTQLVIFLEEPSAKEMLKGLLPRLLPENINPNYVVFEGKQDLEKRFHRQLRAWLAPDAIFVVMRDQDSGDCVAIKQNLVQKCINAGKPDTLVRIACHELESWYLGDLKATEQAVGPNGLSAKQGKSKFRTPDKLANPSEELKKLSPKYQKVSGSRAIGPLLDIDNNRSISFNIFISGIRRLIATGVVQ